MYNILSSSFLLLLTMVASSMLSSHQQKGYLQTKTLTQCYGKQINFRCPTRHVIRIVSAIYRQSRDCIISGSPPAAILDAAQTASTELDELQGYDDVTPPVRDILLPQATCSRSEPSNPACVGSQNCSFMTPWVYISSRCGYSNQFDVRYQCVPGWLIVPVCSLPSITGAKFGFVSTPGYPHRYSGSQNCSVTIVGPATGLIQLYLIDLHLAAYRGANSNQRRCIDRAFISDGFTQTRYLCVGLERGLVYTSSSNQATIHFSSTGRDSVPAKGFWFYFEILEPSGPVSGRTLHRIHDEVSSKTALAVANSSVSRSNLEHQPTLTAAAAVAAVAIGNSSVNSSSSTSYANGNSLPSSSNVTSYTSRADLSGNASSAEQRMKKASDEIAGVPKSIGTGPDSRSVLRDIPPAMESKVDEHFWNASGSLNSGPAIEDEQTTVIKRQNPHASYYKPLYDPLIFTLSNTSSNSTDSAETAPVLAVTNSSITLAPHLQPLETSKSSATHLQPLETSKSSAPHLQPLETSKSTTSIRLISGDIHSPTNASFFAADFGIPEIGALTGGLSCFVLLLVVVPLVAYFNFRRRRYLRTKNFRMRSNSYKNVIMAFGSDNDVTSGSTLTEMRYGEVVGGGGDMTSSFGSISSSSSSSVTSSSSSDQYANTGIGCHSDDSPVWSTAVCSQAGPAHQASRWLMTMPPIDERLEDLYAAFNSQCDGSERKDKRDGPPIRFTGRVKSRRSKSFDNLLMRKGVHGAVPLPPPKDQSGCGHSNARQLQCIESKATEPQHHPTTIQVGKRLNTKSSYERLRNSTCDHHQADQSADLSFVSSNQAAGQLGRTVSIRNRVDRGMRVGYMTPGCIPPAPPLPPPSFQLSAPRGRRQACEAIIDTPYETNLLENEEEDITL